MKDKPVKYWTRIEIEEIIKEKSEPTVSYPVSSHKRLAHSRLICYIPVFDSFEMIKLQKSQIFQGILQFSYFVTHVASKLFFGKSYDRF